MGKPYTPFGRLLQQIAVERFGEAALTPLAKAIDVSLSGLTRNARGESSMELESCLRLARFSGRSPSEILRLAGRSEMDDLLRSLYGQEQHPLSDVDRQLVALAPDVKRAAIAFVQSVQPREPSRRERKTGTK